MAPHPRLRDRVAVVLFAVLWLVPLAYRGIIDRRPIPATPRLISDLQNISCLFSFETPTWNAYYLQVRTTEEGPWVDFDESSMFELEPFGHRTRLHRYLVNWRHNERGREELAQWIMAREAELNPDERPPIELRFLWAWFVVDEANPPTGSWVRPPLRSAPRNQMKVLSTHRAPQ